MNRGVVKVSLPALAHILNMGDYNVVMADVDHSRQVLNLMVSHASLPDVGEGEEAPIIEAIFIEGPDGTIKRQDTLYEEARKQIHRNYFIGISIAIFIIVAIVSLWVAL